MAKTKASASIAADSLEVCWGKHVGLAEFDAERPDDYISRVSFTKKEFVKLVTEHRVRSTKDGPFITRPMNGDGRRTDENAAPWALVPIDMDELQPNDMPYVLKWCEDSKLAGCLATTYSHRAADRPKLRYWMFASRPILVSEHAFVHKALNRLFPVKLDGCMLKPSQPVFLPACPEENKADAFAKEIEGEPLDVDRLLNGFREEIEEETRRRAERIKGVGTGVRQPGGLIDFFNAHYDLVELLEQHNYKRKGRNRFTAPGSKSRRAALVLYDHSLVSFHDPANDPLAQRSKHGQALVLDAFAAWCSLNHANDFKAAFGAAAKWARTQGWSDSTSPPEKEKVAHDLPPPILFNPEELYLNLRPQHMLVEGILDQGSVVIASGDSNSGKTTILQLLSLQIATGGNFGANRTKKGRVLWIAGEDMENAKYRTVAMCEEYAIDPKSIGDELLLLPQPVAILDIDSMKSLKEAIENRAGAGAEFAMIVVDSKSVNWGGVDENSNDENAMFINAVRRHLIEPFGNPAVLITHHLTKQRDKESQSSRGGGALINNADHEWRFNMNQDAHLSDMQPGSKVRMERWPAQRFLIKTVNLPEAKFPQLKNNFGGMPRISIAEPVNHYNRSMQKIKQDAEVRAVLQSMVNLSVSKKPNGLTHVAADLGWADAAGKVDYRKVKRMLEIAAEQKLVSYDPSPKAKGKEYKVIKAGKDYLATDAAIGADVPDSPPDSDDDPDQPDDIPA